MAEQTGRLSTLSSADRAQVEAVLFEFDQSWSPERLAVTAAALPGDNPSLRRATLGELIKIDLERCWQAGTGPIGRWNK